MIRSRGVAILFKKSLSFQMTNCIQDRGGQFVIVKGVMCGEEIAIMNMYFPSGHPCDVLTNVFFKLLEIFIVI